MKCKPVPWEEPEPERVKGRGFKNNDVKRGYMSEPIDSFPQENPFVRRRNWRKEREDGNEMY